MGKLLAAITGQLSSNVGETVKQIASIWKVDPAIVLQNQTEVAKMANDLTVKTLQSVDTEIQSAADIIKAEAQSQSWLPRNVRPLLLLLWGLCLTFNMVAAIIVYYCTGVHIAAMQLDPWVYKLTAIGYTGYVTARTWEKVTEKDN